MKGYIEVENRKEADLIKRGLADPEVRAFVKVVGALLPLSERARVRVLRFVADQVDEERNETVEQEIKGYAHALYSGKKSERIPIG